MPITVPKNVTIDVGDGSVRVKGPKGELARDVPRQISIITEDGTLRVERGSDEPTQRSLHGLMRSLIASGTAARIRMIDARRNRMSITLLCGAASRASSAPSWSKSTSSSS